MKEVIAVERQSDSGGMVLPVDRLIAAGCARYGEKPDVVNEALRQPLFQDNPELVDITVGILARLHRRWAKGKGFAWGQVVGYEVRRARDRYRRQNQPNVLLEDDTSRIIIEHTVDYVTEAVFRSDVKMYAGRREL